MNSQVFCCSSSNIVREATEMMKAVVVVVVVVVAKILYLNHRLCCLVWFFMSQFGNVQFSHSYVTNRDAGHAAGLIILQRFFKLYLETYIFCIYAGNFHQLNKYRGRLHKWRSRMSVGCIPLELNVTISCLFLLTCTVTRTHNLIVFSSEEP